MTEQKNHLVTEGSDFDPSINVTVAPNTKPNSDAINQDTVVKPPVEREEGIELMPTKAKVERKRKPKYERKEHKIQRAKIRFESQPTWEFVPVNLRKPDDVLERQQRKDGLADDLAPKEIYTRLKNNDKVNKDNAVKEKKEADARDVEISKKAKYLMWTWLGEQWWLLLLGFPFMFLASLSDLFVPDYIGKIVDALVEENYEGGEESVNTRLKEWMIILLAGVGFNFLHKAIFGLTAERLGNGLRRKLFYTIITKDVEFYDENRTGELLSRISSDTQVVQEGLTMSVGMAVTEIVKVLVVIIILCYYSWVVAIFTVLSLAPGIVFTNKARNLMEESGRQVQKAKATMSSTAEESISNIKTVKSFAEEAGHIEKFENASYEVFEHGRTRAYFWSIFFFSLAVLGNGSTILLIYLISVYFNDLDMTPGKATTVLMYTRTITMAISGVNSQLVNLGKVWGSSFKCAKMMVAKKNVLWEGTEKITNNQQGDFDAEEVKFAYPSKPEVTILKGTTLDIRTNQIVALVGPSGCGKSSIISLLERFYDPDEGKMLFNNIDLKDLDNAWYHQTQIAIVQQEPILFSGSIKQNILYGVDFGQLNKAQINERLEEACKMANCLNFIQDKSLFPEGFETKVGERGLRLSGGQKQRVAIARALVRRPKVLLLDEATSALDAESEFQVQQALDGLIEASKTEEGSSMTVVVIAHRLSTIIGADKIVVLKAGEIAETGTHEELVQLDGIYKKLVARQMKKDEVEQIGKDLEHLGEGDTEDEQLKTSINDNRA